MVNDVQIIPIWLIMVNDGLVKLIMVNTLVGGLSQKNPLKNMPNQLGVTILGASWNHWKKKGYENNKKPSGQHTKSYWKWP